MFGLGKLNYTVKNEDDSDTPSERAEGSDPNHLRKASEGRPVNAVTGRLVRLEGVACGAAPRALQCL